MIVAMNPQSLDRANAFLAAVAARTEVGEVLPGTPADIGHELAFPDALSTARAVRALIARKRLEAAEGSYRLLDARPVEAGEREVLGRRPRKAREPKASPGGRSLRPRPPRPRCTPTWGVRPSIVSSSWDARPRSFVQACEQRERRRGRHARRAWVPSSARRSWARRSESSRPGPRWPRPTSGPCWRPCEAARRSETQPVGDSEMEAILGVLKGGEEATSRPPLHLPPIDPFDRIRLSHRSRRRSSRAASRPSWPPSTPPRDRGRAPRSSGLRRCTSPGCRARPRDR